MLIVVPILLSFHLGLCANVAIECAFLCFFPYRLPQKAVNKSLNSEYRELLRQRSSIGAVHIAQSIEQRVSPFSRKAAIYHRFFALGERQSVRSRFTPGSQLVVQPLSFVSRLFTTFYANAPDVKRFLKRLIVVLLTFRADFPRSTLKWVEV